MLPPDRVVHVVDDANTSIYSAAMSSVTASVYTGASSIQSSSHHHPEPLDLLIDHDHVLYGRDIEVQRLQEAFARVHDGTSTSEVVIVHGPSGTGKTILVNTALRNHTSFNQSFFLYGKYDQMQLTGNTCSGICSAFSDLCELLLSSTYEKVLNTKTALRDKLGSEAKALTRLVPNLHYLLPEIGNNHWSDIQGGSRGFTRVIQLCCTFLEVIITIHGTIVIFLDDIQWADKESVDVMKALARSNSILVVGAFRDRDESKVDSIQNVDAAGEQDLSDLIDGFCTPSAEENTKTRSEVISLGNLNVESINLKVSELTRMTKEQTWELSEVIFQKTMGNAFSVRQFLERLLRTGMLRMNGGEDREGESESENKEKIWAWNLDRIRSETDVSDNVLLLVTRKIECLQRNIQEVLQFAAFLGYRFDPKILDMVVQTAILGHSNDPNMMTVTDTSSHTFQASTVGDDSLGVETAGEASLVTQLINNVDTSDLLSTGRQASAHSSLQTIQGSSQSSLQALTSSTLATAMKEKLVEKGSGDSYKFTHDRIQQALHKMVDEDTKLKLHNRIGRLVLDMCNEESDDAAAAENLLLLAVDNLNLGGSEVTAKEGLVQLAEYNSKAAKVAVSKLSFGSAAKYLEKALTLLDEDPSNQGSKWKRCYDLSLEVIRTSAYVNYCLANHQLSYKQCQEVIQNAKTLEDTFEVNKTLVLNVGNQKGGLRRGLDEGFAVLKKVGEIFPVKPQRRHILAEAKKVKRILRGKTDKDLKSLTPMTDKNKLHAMDIMSSMFFMAFASPDTPEFFALLGFRMTYLTCRYGASKWATVAFALFGALVGGIGNLAGCKRFLKIVESLSEDAPIEAKARSLCIVNIIMTHFFVPFSQGMNGLQDAYRAGMQCGDINFALASLTNYTYIAVNSNMDLAEVAAEGSYIQKQIRDFGHDNAALRQVMSLQYTHNLLGWVDDFSKLIGDACDEDELRAAFVKEGNTFLLAILDQFRFFLAVEFDRYQTLHEEIIPLSGVVKKYVRSHFTMHKVMLMIGLGAFKLIHRMKANRKIRSIARDRIKQANRLVNANVENSKPVACCLMAENVAFDDRNKRRKIREVVELYDSAIASARRFETLQFEGMINQRAGEVLIDVYNDVGRGVEYLKEAVRVYSRWGADGKVSFLRSGPYGQYL